MFSFVSRCDCVEVAAEDTLCGKGYELTLFLFTDVLLIAKKKETCRYFKNRNTEEILVIFLTNTHNIGGLFYHKCTNDLIHFP